MRSTVGVVAAIAVAALAVTAAAAPAPSAGAPLAAAARPAMRPSDMGRDSAALPPTTAQCEAMFHLACYAPSQVQRAYDMAPLYAAGLTGRGRTIVIVDSFGSPTIRRDLTVFDRAFGLPAPPKLSIIQPAGRVRPYDPHNGTRVGWAEETTLDVEWSHAMAPGANIVLVETPDAETEGTVGFPTIVRAENFVIDHHLGDVITQSFGTTEQTFGTRRSLLNLRTAFVNAAAHGVSVLASSGDSGAASERADGSDLYLHRANSWPSSDPLVTSVGGTQLHLNARGDRTGPDNVWNEQQLFRSPAASGGGVSEIFARPGYQDGVRGVVGARRGTPDISMSAAVNGGVLTYESTPGSQTGWSPAGGTSASSPMFAGIVAIAGQAAGHDLGLLNPALYALGAQHAAGIVDIGRGDNTVTFTQHGKTYTVHGYRATAGYDLASGLGTVDAARLVAELAGLTAGGLTTGGLTG